MKFILIDGSYYIFYRFHALLQWWKNAHPDEPLDDPSVNETFVSTFNKTFISKFKEMPKKLGFDKDESYIVMTGKDCPRETIWRMKHFPSYKSQRVYEDNFTAGNFFKRAYETLFTQFENNTILSYNNLEADDCIAITSKHILETYEDAEIYIITSDMDYLQLADNRVHLYNLKYKLLTESKTAFTESDKNLKCKIIMGDKSDNIPPIFKGCGIKTAAKLYDNPHELAKKLQDPQIKDQYDLNELIVDFNKIPIELITGFRKEILKLEN